MRQRKILAYLPLLLMLLLNSNFRAAADPAVLSEPPDGSHIAVRTIASGSLPRPSYITDPGDGTNRLFLVLQVGMIRVIQDGVLLDEPFLDLTDKVSELDQYSEQGMFGLVFHPDYENNGRFFVNYSLEENDAFQIEEFHVSADDPNVADPTSGRIILYTDNFSEDHYGGQLLFGTDGYLYIGIGDGIGPGDQNRTAQDLNSVHGKILRINVEDETRPYRLIRDNPYVGVGRAEVWAYGFRNPYAFSFDINGDLYIADVGQDKWEEINVIPAGNTGGANFGWSRFENDMLYNRDVAAKSDMLPPVMAYEHGADRCAIIGGHVYRGEAFPELQGVYIFSDWCASNLMGLYKNEAGDWEMTVLTNLDGVVGITSIGVDTAGEMYVTYYDLDTGIGGVVKVVPGG